MSDIVDRPPTEATVNLEKPGSFNDCLRIVLAHEGGWSDHPSDPGGKTMQGVTQRVYDAFRADTALPVQSVRDISEAEVREIYEERYWRPAGCDRLARGLSLIVFDTAVNMGVSRAAKYLQTAVSVKPDGQIGPLTLRAVAKFNPRVLVGLIFVQRRAFYTASPNYGVFGKGWIRRLNAVSAQSELWAMP